MAELFTLDVTPDSAARTAALRLKDRAGVQLAFHQIGLAKHAPARWDALFDTRAHVRRMTRSEPPAAQLAALGDFLGQHVLGPEITRLLADGIGTRTLLVRVPDAPDDSLASSFAGVPWEMARAPGDTLTLLKRGVAVRVAFADAKPGKDTLIAPDDGPVRVLLVFADPPGARPLAARLERERLRELFFDEILPSRNVEVDVLCHGVTRVRLEERIKARGGYHVVHWSGHGNVNTLSLADGTISGEGLVGLFRDAGAFVPAVVLLAACLSGSLAAPKDWASLRASMNPDADVREGERVDGAGATAFAGTALSLMRAGVKQVAAMRWEVGDVYARRLAKRFYRHLLADKGQHGADKALWLARGELLRDAARTGKYHAVDHATPVVFGAEAVRFAPGDGPSEQVERRQPTPQPLLGSRSKELDPPWGFVGRGEELTKLLGTWMARPSETPIALVQGLAGLGKTSLAAEVVHLGHERFDYVLAFQAKGGPLSPEAFFTRVDERLSVESPAYAEHCRKKPRHRVFLPSEEAWSGEARYEQLAENLLRALGAERVLLVLDNFETNLAEEQGAYRCKDAAWTLLFEILVDRLGATGSRVIVTSRHKPAVLEGKALWIPLGALPIAEARLYFQNHAALQALWYGGDASFPLVQRILDVSRGHPLILARIADLATRHYDEKTGLSSAGRAALEEALATIQGKGFQALPDIFAGVKGEAEREREYEYLNDVAIGAVDLLIGRLGKDARRLLWVVTRAGEPVFEMMVEAVWGASPAALLGELCGTGLLTREGASYAFHELVGERATAWMEEHDDERGEKTEVDVWKAYGEWYGAAFAQLQASGKPGSRDLASEMGRRGIRYLVLAQAFESLGIFASGVVTGTRDPMLLGSVIADLQAVAAEVPAGEARWRLRTNLADALARAGHSDQALPLFAQAAEEAEAASGWAEVGWICQGWAHALRDVCQLDRARETHLRGAEASRQAGRPRGSVMGSELEALRIDVMQGRSANVLPAIEEKLAEARSWWVRHQRGEPVPETSSDEELFRLLVGGIDIAHHASIRTEHWQRCLDLNEEMEQVERAVGTGEHEIARTRFKHYGPLIHLGKLDDARMVLQGCLDTFRGMESVADEAMTLSALADVWDRLDDPWQGLAFERRALALFEHLPNPGERAISHHNLANYLHKTASPVEARAHQLADLVYKLVTGLDTQLSLRNLALRIHQSAARNEPFTLPTLPTLLADPAFAPLATFLTDRAVDLDALQAQIDHLVAHARASLPSPP